MGAWGSGPFDNDDALDWSIGFVEGNDPVTVAAAALKTATESDALFAPEASQAIAAAAAVALALGLDDVADAPEEVRDQVRLNRAALASLAGQATAALDRILEDSELPALWDEADEGGAWAAETRTLRDMIINAADQRYPNA